MEYEDTHEGMIDRANFEIDRLAKRVAAAEAERDQARQWAAAWKALAKRIDAWLHLNAHLNATLVMRQIDPDYLPPTERELRTKITWLEDWLNGAQIQERQLRDQLIEAEHERDLLHDQLHAALNDIQAARLLAYCKPLDSSADCGGLLGASVAVEVE